MKIIRSLDNQSIKKFRSLSVRKYREQFGLCLIEGEKVIKEALREGLVQNLIIDETRSQEFSALIQENDSKVILVTPEILSSLSSATTCQGIVAVVRIQKSKPIDVNKNLLVLDHLQDPGNLGTIIRSGVASGHLEIILVESVDPYNDKTLRSTSGTIFYPNFTKMKQDEFIEFAKSNKLNILLADMDGQNIFESKNDFSSPYALVIGSEGQGVSNNIRELPHKKIAIPMNKEVESLNAGVSASVIMFNLANRK